VGMPLELNSPELSSVCVFLYMGNRNKETRDLWSSTSNPFLPNQISSIEERNLVLWSCGSGETNGSLVVPLSIHFIHFRLNEIGVVVVREKAVAGGCK